jgi:hypothetical protein
MSRQKDHNAHRSTGGGEVLRTVLPHNLAASLKHLPEHDIMRLTEALAVEMGSRGLTAAKEKISRHAKTHQILSCRN